MERVHGVIGIGNILVPTLKSGITYYTIKHILKETKWWRF